MLRRVLHSIGNQIDQNLPESYRICQHMIVPDFFYIHIKNLVFVNSCLTAYSIHNFHGFAQVQWFLMKHRIPTLNFRHIQNLIDQLQKVSGRIVDLLKTIQNTRRIVQMIHGDLGHTKYSIHRSANVMGHTAEENAFCLVCLFCRLICLLQTVHQLFISAVAFLNICRDHSHHARHNIFLVQTDKLEPHPAVSIFCPDPGFTLIAALLLQKYMGKL